MAHQSALIAQNIEEYLEQHENKDVLRFITAVRWMTGNRH
jgi:sulfate adenylyltransferase subunit 1